METELSLEYPTPEFAKSIMKAIEPDNKLADRALRIEAKVRGRILIVNIEGCKRIETLEATVQDIFRCIRAAENSLAKATSDG
jgi:tRNA threonylcarbamoyladenosine modification (KEOPS) complex  Pcc1 subunit